MSKAFKIGDCEASHLNGGGINVKIFPSTPGIPTHHTLWLCQECLDEENAATERSQKIVEHARKVDTLIELKADLFGAGTIPFVEITAAIQQNPSIPDSEKNIRILEEVSLRIGKLSEAIFADKAALQAKENERYALQINAQKLAASLHVKDRERFKQFDVNYKPAVKSTPKPRPVTSPKKFNKKELYEVANKYGVPAVALQGLVVRKNLSYEDAAKEIANTMGLTN